jgi:hypothetical protein
LEFGEREADLNGLGLIASAVDDGYTQANLDDAVRKIARAEAIKAVLDISIAGVGAVNPVTASGLALPILGGFGAEMLSELLGQQAGSYVDGRTAEAIKDEPVSTEYQGLKSALETYMSLQMVLNSPDAQIPDSYPNGEELSNDSKIRYLLGVGEDRSRNGFQFFEPFTDGYEEFRDPGLDWLN